jgi:hypothetical protein
MIEGKVVVAAEVAGTGMRRRQEEEREFLVPARFLD